jgi:hypothetical protein
MNFKHKGREAIAMFDVLDYGMKPLKHGPSYHSDDPYSHEGELPDMKFVSAMYTDNEEEIKDLSAKEIDKLQDDAAENYADRNWSEE